LEILRGLRGINLVGMDVVEVSPPYDHAEVTALAGAAVAMELVCLYAARLTLWQQAISLCKQAVPEVHGGVLAQ
jgi:agmatinase